MPALGLGRSGAPAGAPAPANERLSGKGGREFDIILLGATGDAGSAIAGFLARRSPPLKWAIAGRNLAKLERLASTLASPPVKRSVPSSLSLTACV